ncbi:MAG TPA: hypothetical protein VG028_13305 [Terriglobia bacterium]|nr:hypothetical protein [Terriglobia bacterium]
MPEWPYIVEATDLPEYPPNQWMEPICVTAGDTLLWYRSVPPYLASAGWTLHYSLRGVPGSAIDFDSTPYNVDDHQVNVTAATTSAWLPGEYTVQGYAVNAGTGERHLIFEGFIKVKANLQSADASYDGRSHARKCLDAIEATLEGRAADDILDSTIEGTIIRRMNPQDLLLYRDRYRAEVRTEEAKAKISEGRATGRNIYARFTTPI